MAILLLGGKHGDQTIGDTSPRGETRRSDIGDTPMGGQEDQTWALLQVGDGKNRHERYSEVLKENYFGIWFCLLYSILYSYIVQYKRGNNINF